MKEKNSTYIIKKKHHLVRSVLIALLIRNTMDKRRKYLKKNKTYYIHNDKKCKMVLQKLLLDGDCDVILIKK